MAIKINVQYTVLHRKVRLGWVCSNCGYQNSSVKRIESYSPKSFVMPDEAEQMTRDINTKYEAIIHAVSKIEEYGRLKDEDEKTARLQTNLIKNVLEFSNLTYYDPFKCWRCEKFEAWAKVSSFISEKRLLKKLQSLKEENFPHIQFNDI